MFGLSRSVVHPLAGMRLSRLVRAIRQQGVPPRYSGQLAIMLACALLREPFCCLETASAGRRVADVKFDPPPVFIVGHWRSGTTFLHTLMSKDEGFCFPTVLDALRPDAFFPNPFERISRAILLRSLPETRPMDDVPLQGGLPQEDEMALASMGVPSFFNCFYFPGKLTDIFKREVLFVGLSKEQLEAWKEALRFYLAKLCLLHPGRRLLIKNPAHSARIMHLRALFPGAKFIHIHRHPTDVASSTIKLYRTVLPLVALQDYDPAAIEAHVARTYPQIMDRLLADLADLPAKDAVEIRFEDLVRDPVEVLAGVYRRLELPGFDRARSSIAAYANAHTRAVPSSNAGARGFREDDAFSAYRTRLGYRAS